MSDTPDSDDPSPIERLRDIISQLRKPVTDLNTITALLASPLSFLSLLPSKFRRFDTHPIKGSVSPQCVRYISQLQEVITENALPTWAKPLEEEGLSDLVDIYFVPPPSSASHAAGLVGLGAFSSLLASLRHSPRYPADKLRKLVADWPVDRVHEYIHTNHLFVTDAQRETAWSDYLRVTFAIPARLSNALGEDVPDDLNPESYFGELVRRSEVLVYNVSRLSKRSTFVMESATQLLLKMINTGLFPPSLPATSTQVSFFNSNRIAIMSRLGDPGHGDEYSQIWNHLIEALPFTSAQKVISSLLGSIEWQDGLVYAATARRKIIQEARFLRAFVGPLAPGSQERWEVVSSVTLGQAWPTEVALVLVRWVAGDQRQVEEAALGILIQRCLEIWSVPQYIKYSLLSRHRYMTAVLLLAISLLPPSSDHLRSLSTSRPFLESIGLYIGHTDPSIRRCGMLVAEEVASRLGQKLDFGDWDEEGQGREWCRDLRRLSEGFGAWDEGDLDTPVDEQSAVDTQQIVRADHETDSEEKDTKVPPPHLDSDDESLVGYASTAPSSRSNSPTPSELEEIEKDPSLTLGRTTRKVQKPVYLLQLGELLEPGKGNDQTEPARHETALNEGASLIRRKQGYGLELEENAVNLACEFIRLQDNFDLEGFDEKRQAALNTLVACCPERAAPCLIEQFFTGQYSASVRSAILTALALGARELAGLAPPPTNVPHFPSKVLPPKLHQKYIANSDVVGPGPVLRIMEGISRNAIDRTRDATEDKVPQVVREKQLRVRPKFPSGSIQVGEGGGPQAPRRSTFNDLAAEFFVMPLINRFWVHLRDEQTREVRTQYSKTAYKGAGTGLVLNATTLGQYLLTLAVLLHAARHSPAFLAVLAPEAIELAITMGTRPATLSNEDEKETKAGVLASALELTLVALDISRDLDSGKSLGLEHGRLLMAVREWAGRIFETLDRGLLVEEGGGREDERMRKASAGVLLSLEEIGSKWRASMLQF